jgi:hypothetical protein
VPCLRRAAAVEEYGDRNEREVEAEDGGEGWLTAERASPASAAAAEPGATTTNADGFEEIPSIEDEGAGAGGAGLADAGAPSERGGGGGGGEEEVPDIDELDLEDEEEDQVGS